jgi:hypothetical protein
MKRWMPGNVGTDLVVVNVGLPDGDGKAADGECPSPWAMHTALPQGNKGGAVSQFD